MLFQTLQLQLHLHEELQLAHTSLKRKEEELRKVKAELSALRTSKSKVDELAKTLSNEYATLHVRVAAYQEELKIADEIRHGYDLTLTAKDVELVIAREKLAVAKKELRWRR